MKSFPFDNVNPAWERKRLGELFTERRETVSDKDFMPLSVTMAGVVPQLENVAKTDNNDNRKLVRKGDIVVNSRSDRKGACGLSEYDGSVSVISIVLKPNNGCPRFLHYLMRSTAFQEEFYRWGQGIVADLWSTRFSQAKSIMIGLPTLDEQIRIAHFLDREVTKIERLIEKQKELASSLHERFEALLEEIFDSQYTLVRLRWLTDILPGFAFPSQLFMESGYRLVRGVNVTPGALRWDDTVYINSVGSEAYERYRLQADDILVGMDRPWIVGGLRVLRYPTDPEPTYLVQRVARLRSLGRLAPRYAEYCLRSRRFWGYVEPDMTGVSVPHISDKQIGDFRVPLPSLHQQDTIVQRLEEQIKIIDAGVVSTRRILNSLDERRAALITAAVTGHIEVASGIVMEAAE